MLPFLLRRPREFVFNLIKIWPVFAPRAQLKSRPSGHDKSLGLSLNPTM
jgi:hypothetical protein